VLGVIPRERICVTPRARLGFHAAWHPTENGIATSRSATKLLMEIYPEHVRTWIKNRGGLTRKLLVLSGSELAAMYPTCPETRQAGGSRESRQAKGSRRSHATAAAAKTPPATAMSAITE
jgi:hypothetical protein